MKRWMALLVSLILLLPFGMGVYAKTDAGEQAAVAAAKEHMAADRGFYEQALGVALDDSALAVEVLGKLYTGGDNVTKRLTEMEENALLSEPNLMPACVENEGYVVYCGVDRNVRRLLMMQLDEEGSWQVVGEIFDPASFMLGYRRYKRRTDVENPACYFASDEELGDDCCFFDDSAESCYVLRVNDNHFYRSEKLMQHWYDNAMIKLRAGDSDLTWNTGMLNALCTEGVRTAHPKGWIDVIVLLLCAWAAAGFLYLLIRHYHSAADPDSWIRKIPLSYLIRVVRLR